MKVFLLSGNYDHCPKLRPKWAVRSHLLVQEAARSQSSHLLQVLEVTYLSEEQHWHHATESHLEGIGNEQSHFCHDAPASHSTERLDIPPSLPTREEEGWGTKEPLIKALRVCTKKETVTSSQML